MIKLYTLVKVQKGKETVYMTDSFKNVNARKKTLETSQRGQRPNYSIREANSEELKYQRPPSFNFDPSGDANSKNYRNRKAKAKRIKQKNPRNSTKG